MLEIVFYSISHFSIKNKHSLDFCFKKSIFSNNLKKQVSKRNKQQK